MRRHHHHHCEVWRDASYLIGGITRLGWLQDQTPGPHGQPEADGRDSYWPSCERLVRRVAPSCLSHGIRPDPMPSLDVKVIRPASAAVKIASIVDPRFRVLGGVLQQRLMGLQQLNAGIQHARYCGFRNESQFRTCSEGSCWNMH